MAAPFPGDVPLDLQTPLALLYEESEYNQTVDYRQSPPPSSLPAETEVWLDSHLTEAGLRP